MRRNPLAVAGVMSVLALLTACTGSNYNAQGPLQPQTVNGPCQVQRFFLSGTRSVPTTMTVANTGQACQLTLINPALNAVLNAALLSRPAQHGTATSGLISGYSQAGVSYTPTPGYVGPDKFEVTIEPGAVTIIFNVTVAKTL